MKKKIDLLSQLLREFEAEIGMKDLDTVILEALIISVEALKVPNLKEFNTQFKKLVKVISQTEPKFGILNYQLTELKSKLNDLACSDKKIKSIKVCKQKFIKEIRNLINESRQQQKLILKNAEKINVEGKTILIHDHSHTVQDVLVHFKAMGKRFKIVIAEQNYEKTHDNIERMHKSRIPFQVIPAYMLSHIHDEIDMVFFGAVTLKDSMLFVMQPGTHSVLSEFHIADVPIYMFLNTLKFSLWKSKKRLGIFMQKHTRTHHLKPIQYKRIKYSHDRVPTKFFHKIVTNEGILTPQKIKKLYTEKFTRYQKLKKN